jgi:cobalt-zinc-cadmium efflux system membrane fusion protein
MTITSAMKSGWSFTACLAAALFLMCSMSVPAAASPGHDHGPATAASAAPAAFPRVLMTSENFQFVGIVEGEVLVIYLDRADDNEPVRSASIEVSLEGEAFTALLQGDGTYEVVAPLLKKPGQKEVLATIIDDDKSDLLVGAVSIPEGAAQPTAVGTVSRFSSALADLARNVPVSRAEAKPAVAGAGLVGFGVFLGAMLGRRRKTAFVVLFLSIMAFASTAALADAGHDHGSEPSAGTNGNAPQRRSDGSIFLPKPSQRLLEIRTEIIRKTSVTPTTRFNGRIIADPRLSGLVQSSIGGRFVGPEGGVLPQGASVKMGQLLGRVKPSFASIDSSQLFQSLAELDQQIAANKQKLARQEPLLKTNTVPLAQVEEIRFLLTGQIDRRRELVESLSREEELVAPVTGVIAAGRVVAGQVVSQSDRLFEIVNPARPLVEALVFDPTIVGRMGDAEMTLSDGTVVELRFLSRSRTLQQQYASIHFEVVTPARDMNIGQPVSITIKVGEAVTGLVVPRAALAQAPNGQTVVFEHKDPETFVPRAVRTEILDSRRVRVLSGLNEGDKIVTRNAPLLNQVR